MCGAATELPVVHNERRGKTQQGLNGQESHLPAAGNRPTLQERPELIPRLGHCQLQVVRKVSHGERVLSPGVI